MSGTWVPKSPNTINFLETVTSESIDLLISAIEEMHKSIKNGASVQLLINSAGGDVKSATAFSYKIQESGIPLVTYGYSIESAALLIYLTGTSRVAHKTRTRFFLHEARVHIDGEQDERTAFNLAKELQRHNRLFAECVAERTNLKEKDVLKLMQKNTWLDVEKAKELGIVHEIIG